MMKIELSGEQKKVLTLPPTNPVLIKGGAGSGKTLVAVKRAEHLYLVQQSEMFIKTNICIFAYNTALTDTIRKMVAYREIQVQRIDQWVFHFLLTRGVELEYLKAEELKACRIAALAFAKKELAGEKNGNKLPAISQKNDAFYEEEICWIKGRRIKTLEEYLDTKRTGRGTEDRVTASDRHFLWMLFTNYQEQLGRKNILDWDDRVEKALQIIENDPDFVPPFSHIVVDEAQDFSFAKLQLVSRLINPDTQSITIVADTAQQIYQSGFSWAEVGLSVRGRSIEFTHNYRNTRQIADFSSNLLSLSRDSADYSPMVAPRKEGEKPAILAGTLEQEIDYFADRRSSIPGNESVVVATKNHKDLSKFQNIFTKMNYEVVDISRGKRRSGRIPSDHIVYLSTLHALKGLEFFHVFLFGMNRETLLPSAVQTDEDLQRLLRLTYVSMTRARNTLTLFTEGKQEIFLPDMDQGLFSRGTLTEGCGEAGEG